MFFYLNSEQIYIYIIYLFSIISFIQILYYIFFFIRIPFYKKDKKKLDIDYEINGVSLVIPIINYNEERILNLIKLTSKTKYNKFEIVLVLYAKDRPAGTNYNNIQNINNNIKIVQLHQESKYIFGDKYPISIGIKSASYDTIILTKEDCIPNSELWIDNIVEKFENNKQTKILLGFFNYKEDNSLFNKFMIFENLHLTMQFLSYSMAKIPIMGVGRNMAFSRQLFYDNKGFSAFNDFWGGEDNLLINSMANNKNTLTYFDENSTVNCIKSINYSEWLFYKKIYLSTIKCYHFLHKFIIGLYSISHILFFLLTLLTCVFFTFNTTLWIIILIRNLLVYSVTTATLYKLNNKQFIKWIPIMDIFMSIYYLLISVYYFKKPQGKI